MKIIGINSKGNAREYIATICADRAERDETDPNCVSLYFGQTFTGNVWLDRIEPDDDLASMLGDADALPNEG